MSATYKVVKDVGLHWLESTMTSWEYAIDSMPMVERQDLARWLSGLCIQAARLIGYLEARGDAGCGDNGHADGVKQSNKRAAKVRKALGYLQARDDCRF